jgi:hypothetical protein
MTSDNTRPADATTTDALYAAIVSAHDGLDEVRSRRLDAALILLLVDALADPAAVERLLASARALAMAGPAETTPGGAAGPQKEGTVSEPPTSPASA